MRIRLRTRLSLAIALISLVSLFIISIAVNFFLEQEFRLYAIRKQEQRNMELVKLLEAQYSRLKSWNVSVIENIGVSVLEESLIISVEDMSGNPVWDALEYNSGICHTMIEQMSERMIMKYPSITGGLTHKEYVLSDGGESVGILTVGYYGPFYFSDSEFFFIDTINKILIAVTFIALILSILTGFLIAGNLSAPIIAVNDLAKNIIKGDYRHIENINISTVEVHELLKTINHMALTLKSQEALRKRLTGDVAHELRTPLASLQGELEAMIDGVWDISTARLAGCREEILRLSGLISDMETLSRYDADNIKLCKSNFDLAELVEQTILQHDGLLEENDLSYHYTAESVICYGDQEKIRQVVINLFSNACKFTLQGGKIEVFVEAVDESALLTVRDTGIGIPEDDLSRVFERFYRVDKSRTRSTGGSGIGLAIVKEIVKAHQGDISIQSVPEQGTQVTVSFPFSEEGEV